MATVRALKIDATEGLPAEIPATDDLAALAGAAFTGNVVLSGGAEVTGLPNTPSGDTSATSKFYVDSLVNGLSVVESCRVRNAGEIDNTWTPAGSGVGKTLTSPDNLVANNDIDGVTLVLGDRVLVDEYDGNASDTSNGIYEVTQLADGTTNPTVLTRAVDFDGSPSAEVTDGKTTWVGEGTTYADTQWAVTTNDTITVDTTAIAWTQIGGVGTFVGGDGIDITANTISADIVTTNPGLTFTTGELDVLLDPAGAIIKSGGSGLAANVGDGIEIVANALAVDLSATPGLEFATGELQVLVDPAGAIDRLAAGLHVRTDDATIQINGSNELEVIGAGDANRVSREVTAEENLTAGDPVEWGTVADEVRQCQADVTARIDCVGVMEDTTAAAATGTMVALGEAVGVLVGASPGQRFFVAEGGGLTSSFAAITSGSWIIVVGAAMNATDLWVQPQIIAQKA